ncbi:MAG: STAS domain-containing protein [Spirochaetes bacterium]|nr:STAS domain-containing protein [Spirochaetota bacterium]MBU0955360.1 STAS domain-containing protein [Spirochaetota bacterium]
MKLTILPTKNSAIRCLRIEGDFDLYTAPALSRRIQETQATWKHLHLDLDGVRYLDSSGVGAIIRLLQACKSSGRELTFSGIQGSPRKVLQMSNILALLTEVQLTQVSPS